MHALPRIVRLDRQKVLPSDAGYPRVIGRLPHYDAAHGSGRGRWPFLRKHKCAVSRNRIKFSTKLVVEADFTLMEQLQPIGTQEERLFVRERRIPWRQKAFSRSAT